MRQLAIAVALAVCAVRPARAEVTVDWARGLVIAEGVGVADRRAPNPSVARGTSRRGAEEVAKKLIAQKLVELPFASGATVKDKLKDKATKARFDRAVEDAISLAGEPETDGSWRVKMAVPIEAIRQAILGLRELPAAGDTGPTAIILEGVTAKPSIGWRVGLVDAATLWVTEVPAWAKDAPRVKVKSAKAGTIEAPGIDATAATLFVILQKP